MLSLGQNHLWEEKDSKKALGLFVLVFHWTSHTLQGNLCLLLPSLPLRVGSITSIQYVRGSVPQRNVFKSMRYDDATHEIQFRVVLYLELLATLCTVKALMPCTCTFYHRSPQGLLHSMSWPAFPRLYLEL